VLGGRLALYWDVTSSGVTRAEPDRSDLVYIQGEDRRLTFFSVSSEAARRTFGDLTENQLGGGLNVRLEFGDPGRQNYLKAGTLLRSTNRDSYNQAYSVYGGLPIDELARPAEEIFDGRHTQPSSSVFTVLALTSGGSYSADDRVNAWYGMLQYGLTDRIRVIGGLRAEQWRLRMDVERSDSTRTAVPRDELDVLPSLAVNVSLGERQNLRFSGSQTLARPEYRELAPITYLDIIGGEAVIGNDELERTLIRNADVRWEWYPNAGELLSVAGFYKKFDRPIERVQVGTSGTSLISFANAIEARNFGVELEARKDLGALGRWAEPLSVFSNVTLMRSEITLDTTGVASIQNANRPMVGQAPYVVNTGLTYATRDGRASATVLYNVVGKRIQSAAASGLPDVYENARNMVDFSLRMPVFGSLSAKVDARNLLDARFETVQGPVVREAYDVGRVFSVGFSWSPSRLWGGSNEVSRGR
jgi:TonB-dependent receptor